MKHLDLFSGIGGFALAVDTVWPGAEHTFCEIDAFCQQVLQKHWPNAQIYGDIRTLTNPASQRQPRQREYPRQEYSKKNKNRETASPSSNNSSGSIDLLTGGFPCQPFSQAGKRKGKDDDRFLWPEMLRVIREFHPTWIIGENVAGIINMALEQVCADLEGEGYEVQPFVIPACAVNAPHRRDRVWIIGHAKHDGKPRAKEAGKDCGDESKVSGGTKLSVDESAGTGGIRTTEAGRDASTANPTSKRSRGRTSEKCRTHQRELESEKQERCAVRSESQGCDGIDWERDWQEVAFERCVHELDDGLPRKLVRLPDGSTTSEARWRREGLKAFGNSIVPQVAIEIMKAIKYADE